MLAAFRPFQKLCPSAYIAGAVLSLSILLPLPQNGKILNIGSICTFHSTFGIPCPGCGLTRSFVAMGHGLFQESWRWHPLGPLLFALTAIYFCTAIVAAKNVRPLVLGSRVQVGAIITVAVVMFGFWLLRLNGIFPLPLR